MNAKTLILAAGSSSRLGKKKQLLTFKGTTLLNRAINLSKNCALGDVYVVLGFDAEIIQLSIVDPSITIIHHPQWADGMGTSLAKGIEALPEETSGVFILLTDQIKLSIPLLQSLMSEAEQFPNSIITCRYNNNYGPPTYFPASHFPALRKLEGASGAKKFINDHIEEVRYIDFVGGELDVDVPDDLSRLDN